MPFEVSNKVVVVTGGASGIGRALCECFAVESPASLTVLDLDQSAAELTAAELRNAHPDLAIESMGVDVANERELRTTLAQIQQRDGVIDLYVSNAGVGSAGGIDAPDEIWRHVLDVNLMAHIYASRELLPTWLGRGRGHMLITASAAGLLTNLGDAPYSVSKHGAVALAEWLAVTYGKRGIQISCLCPQGVRTPLLFGDDSQGGQGGHDSELARRVVKFQRIIEPEEVADSVIEALAEDRFLILPHPEVHDYEVARAADRQRWITAMQRLQSQLDPS